MNNTYLIFETWEESTVSLLLAPSLTEAVLAYIAARSEEETVMQPDCSIIVNHQKYAHPLAYIESGHKIEGEWQIFAILSEFGPNCPHLEFRGHSRRYPAEIIDACRPVFRQSHPRRRAKAFAWQIKQGTLVTFYRKTKPWQIEILGRYLWSRSTGSLTIEEWHHDYQTLADSLVLKTDYLPFSKVDINSPPTPH